jgi:hypothetical protein
VVREADAVVLAADVAQILARRGHDVTIPADGVRVVRLCALVLAEFTPGPPAGVIQCPAIAPDAERS